jgi:hypothetical protein
MASSAPPRASLSHDLTNPAVEAGRAAAARAAGRASGPTSLASTRLVRSSTRSRTTSVPVGRGGCCRGTSHPATVYWYFTLWRQHPKQGSAGIDDLRPLSARIRRVMRGVGADLRRCRSVTAAGCRTAPKPLTQRKTGPECGPARPLVTRSAKPPGARIHRAVPSRHRRRPRRAVPALDHGRRSGPPRRAGRRSGSPSRAGRRSGLPR